MALGYRHTRECSPCVGYYVIVEEVQKTFPFCDDVLSTFLLDHVLDVHDSRLLTYIEWRVSLAR